MAHQARLTIRKKLLLGLGCSVIVLLFLECGARVMVLFLPIPYNYKTSEWHVVDNPYWGVWHVPNAVVTHAKMCFSARYSSNSFGMRDRHRELEKTRPRIAVLGDSFVEGVGVDDEQTFTRLLEDRIFEKKVDVLNFATSGGFGTIQELKVYEHLAREFHPDLVILSFLSANDLIDNSVWFAKRNKGPRPVFVKAASGEF